MATEEVAARSASAAWAVDVVLTLNAMAGEPLDSTQRIAALAVQCKGASVGFYGAASATAADVDLGRIHRQQRGKHRQQLADGE